MLNWKGCAHMSGRFEESLIRHCAATLAGHKCGSLFSYRSAPDEDTAAHIAEINVLISGKGLRARLLKRCPHGDLVYLYRPAMLEARLCAPETARFLETLGYGGLSMEGCLAALAQRIHCGEFPHEIGVFLDYPLADVMGFIENGGCNCCCSGCWKAYSNAADAQKRFMLYRKCRDVYLNCYRRGFGVSRLAVAA